jgi:hypothetical protein
MQSEMNRHRRAFAGSETPGAPTGTSAGTSAPRYDETKSSFSEDRLIEFLKAPWDASLGGVPGIGPAARAALQTSGIVTLFQLAGICMTLRAHGMTLDAWHQKVFTYLGSVGVKGRARHDIVRAMSEKLTIVFPEMAGRDEEEDELELELWLDVEGADGTRFSFVYSQSKGLVWPASVRRPPDISLRNLARLCGEINADPKTQTTRLVPEVRGILDGHGFQVKTLKARTVTRILDAGGTPKEGLLSEDDGE